MLSSVFREQSAGWGLLAEQYLSKVILIIHRFILMAVEAVCADPKVREKLVSALLDSLLAKYTDRIGQARFSSIPSDSSSLTHLTTTSTTTCRSIVSAESKKFCGPDHAQAMGRSGEHRSHR